MKKKITIEYGFKRIIFVLGIVIGLIIGSLVFKIFFNIWENKYSDYYSKQRMWNHYKTKFDNLNFFWQNWNTNGFKKNKKEITIDLLSNFTIELIFDNGTIELNSSEIFPNEVAINFMNTLENPYLTRQDKLNMLFSSRWKGGPYSQRFHYIFQKISQKVLDEIMQSAKEKSLTIANFNLITNPFPQKEFWITSFGTVIFFIIAFIISLLSGSWGYIIIWLLFLLLKWFVCGFFNN